MPTLNSWKFRKRARKGQPSLADAMLLEYGLHNGDFDKIPMWRIGYLCAQRDAGLLTWDQWSERVAVERNRYHEGL